MYLICCQNVPLKVPCLYIIMISQHFSYYKITSVSKATGKQVGEHCVRDDKETVFKVGHGCSIWEVWARSADRLPCPPCRGVRPDKEQEVREDSVQPR